MAYSEMVTEKLMELIQIAELEDEPNVEVVAKALYGARMSGDCHIIAEEVQKLLREVLIPKVRIENERRKAQNN